MYAPFSSDLAHHEAVKVPGTYKLMVTPIDDTWTHDFHRFYGIPLS